MSTVLWANYLVNGVVTSDESDKYALYKHADKLDAICRDIGVLPFSEIHDATDARVNLGDAELPAGMESTDELMAKEGVWVGAHDALQMLEALLNKIETENIRFGVLQNAHDAVVEELKESISFAREAAGKSAKFNFGVVM